MMCAPFLILLAAHLAHPFDSFYGVLTRLTACMECSLHRLQAIVPQMRCQRCAMLLLLHGSSQSHCTTNLSSGVDVSGVFTKCEDLNQKNQYVCRQRKTLSHQAPSQKRQAATHSTPRKRSATHTSRSCGSMH